MPDYWSTFFFPNHFFFLVHIFLRCPTAFLKTILPLPFQTDFSFKILNNSQIWQNGHFRSKKYTNFQGLVSQKKAYSWDFFPQKYFFLKIKAHLGFKINFSAWETPWTSIYFNKWTWICDLSAHRKSGVLKVLCSIDNNSSISHWEAFLNGKGRVKYNQWCLY